MRRVLFTPFASSLCSRSFSTKVTLIPGDGIGPEISKSVIQIFEAAQVPIVWETVVLDSGKISDEVIRSFEKTRVGLKGPLATPIGKGHVSLNLGLRKTFNLYANVRPSHTVPGVVTRHTNVDVVVIRENTEGEYSGIEHQVIDGVAQSIKLITREASTRVAKHAFEYAKRHKRSKVTAVHKRSAMKMSDGLFVTCCREVAACYPSIPFSEETLDNACIKLLNKRGDLDVLVLPNLYGDIISDLCAGLIGGLGLTPSANIGDNAALFEAVHGTAPDIAGQNKANPTALLLSGIMMLRHLKMNDKADQIQNAVFQVLQEKNIKTRDLGGSATTDEFTRAIIELL